MRAFGPFFGWLSRWACIIADVVIMPNLAGLSGQYLVLLFDEKASNNIYLTTFIGILFIGAMCWVCWKGIELSARSQVVLLGTEIIVLTIFAVVAFTESVGSGTSKNGGVLTDDDATAAQSSYPACRAAAKTAQSCFNTVQDGVQVVYHSVKPSLSWMFCSGVSSKDLLAGLVLAVFIYWGWDTAVSVNEESTDANRTPGIAAVLSTFLLLGIYLVTAYGSGSLLGPGFTADNSADALGAVALPTILYKLLIIAVLTSASASCQTTILAATRTMLSMGVHKAVPDKLAEVDAKHLTPAFSTWVFGFVSVLWYLLLVIISHNTSTDLYSSSIGAVGMAIALYYGFTGISCIWYYRRWLTKSTKNLVFIGVLPLLGGIMLVHTFFATIRDNVGTDGDHALLFTGTGLLIAGIPFMIWCRLKYPTFFTYRPDPPDTVPDPGGPSGVIAAELGTTHRSQEISSIVVVGIGPGGSWSHAADVAAGYATAFGAAMILVFGYEPSSLGPRGGPFEDQIEEIADEVAKDVPTALAAAHPDLAVTVPPCSSSRTPERPTLTTDPHPAQRCDRRSDGPESGLHVHKVTHPSLGRRARY